MGSPAGRARPHQVVIAKAQAEVAWATELAGVGALTGSDSFAIRELGAGASVK